MVRVVLCAILVSVCLPCSASVAQTAKPKIKVASDGFPSGHDIPEGAASDVVRSLINRDEKLFSSTCIRLFGAGNGAEAYSQFLHETIENIRKEADRKEPSPRGPKSIEKVFAARYLSRSGPASYGYAGFGFLDIMFVDVGLRLHNGEQSMMRILVIKDRDGKWYVFPDPSATPLLSVGLDEEKPSVLNFTDVYDLE